MQDMNVLEQLLYYMQQNSAYVFSQFLRHFLISVYGVLFATVIGIPLGIYIERHRKLSQWVISLTNIIQTVPSMAMMSIIMIVMGLGVNTVITTIFFYSLLPIVKNTYTGMANLSPDLRDIAKGMGMSSLQCLLKVELPLSMSVIMAGIRNALIVAIGITSIGTFIGAGGLGDIITRGIDATDGSAIIIAGALPTALMAIIMDIILEAIQGRFSHQIKG
ncbi:ABC transporter permease [Ignavigranum ruoffiae]|uniref:ABC transporter permease n=1 Tax=Ignavigranum ruoffiae TaxID=89093 RepID=UPI002357C760|nr:ABC transporter permease [Ignavigranum ruoffiae]